MLALAGVLAIGILAGCNNSSTSSTTTPPVPTGSTAKAAYAVAVSTLSTAAPDGKLLVAQTTKPLTATSTPVWEFLIGSPKTDVIWAVVVMNGKGQFQEYSKAGLNASEWAKVPPASDWKIDSDVAIANARKIYPNGKDAAYVPGFVTFVPPQATDASKITQMKWLINFDPASKGSAATSTVEVDMKTGDAALATAK